MIMSIAGILALLLAADDAPDAGEAAAPQPYPTFEACALAEAAYEEGDYSSAISKVNLCMSEEDLAPRDKACALLKRAKFYQAMDQSDKAAGDRDSAVAMDADLKELAQAAECLGSSAEFAAELLELSF